MTDKQNYFTYTDNTSDSNDKTIESLHKQIIIDGVPVQDCCYFDYENDGYEDSCYMYDNECSANCNCYYKQLKCKEQECERLKEGYSELADIVSPYMDDFTGYNEELGGFDIVLCVKELMEQFDQLKAENRELKAVHSTNVALSDELFKYKAENEILEKDKANLDTINETLKVQFNQLKQTLDEIKEIIEPYQKDIQNICSNCNNYDDCHACCKFDLNCYQYKKGDTKACGKFIELKKLEINNLANKILNKISEVENER